LEQVDKNLKGLSWLAFGIALGSLALNWLMIFSFVAAMISAILSGILIVKKAGWIAIWALVISLASIITTSALMLLNGALLPE
jgi:hypothetical protein